MQTYLFCNTVYCADCTCSVAQSSNAECTCPPHTLWSMQLSAPHCLLYAAVRPAQFAVYSCTPCTVCCMQLSAPHSLIDAAVRPALFAVYSCTSHTVCCIQLYSPHCLLYTALLPALFAACSCPPRTLWSMQLSAAHSLLYTAVLPASTAVQPLTLTQLHHTQCSDQCGTVGFQILLELILWALEMLLEFGKK